MSSPTRRRALHKGSFERWSLIVRRAAEADPTTRCWRTTCGKTAAQHGRQWQCGHIHTGDVVGEWARVYVTAEGHRVAAECQKCNSEQGARAGNAMRVQRFTREW